MKRKHVTIVNKLGLHARAAAKFVTLASKFGCEVHIARTDQVVNGKSIMGVMMLAAAKGTEIEIMTSGHDEAEAVNQLTALVNQRFGEDE